MSIAQIYTAKIFICTTSFFTTEAIKLIALFYETVKNDCAVFNVHRPSFHILLYWYKINKKRLKTKLGKEQSKALPEIQVLRLMQI